MADMAAYQPTWEEPIATDFGGQRVFAPGGQNNGGQAVLEALNFAEEMKLDQRQPYWKDPSLQLHFKNSSIRCGRSVSGSRDNNISART
jgi:gamma-glutamyltranspeptidase